MQLSAEQKQKITELECRLFSKTLDDDNAPVLVRDVKISPSTLAKHKSELLAL